LLRVKCLCVDKTLFGDKSVIKSCANIVTSLMLIFSQKCCYLNYWGLDDIASKLLNYPEPTIRYITCVQKLTRSCVI